MSNEVGIRNLDRARAAQMVMAQIVGDELMFAVAVNDAFDDDFQLGELELGSVINVLRSMSSDLAGALVDTQGRALAERLLGAVLAELNEEARS